MKKLSKKHRLVKEAFLRYPTKSDNDIAKITGISQPQISKYRKEYSINIDQEFIAITAGKFIMEFSQAADYWKLQIEELELLKSSKKTIFKTGADGQKFPDEVDLEPMDILAICKQQTVLREKILFLAAQGEVREVIKVMRTTGALPAIAAQ